MINELSYTVVGRPAPQGSKKHGAAGQMLEQSPYLAPWRQAIKRATYQLYFDLCIPPEPDALPVLRGPVEIGLRFRMPEGVPVDGPPDLDKLQRAVWDALTQAHVWEDDGRVVRVLWAEKLAGGEPGCDIYVRTERPAGVAAGGVPVYGGPEAMADAAVRLAGCCGGWLGPEDQRTYCDPCPARPDTRSHGDLADGSATWAGRGEVIGYRVGNALYGPEQVTVIRREAQCCGLAGYGGRDYCDPCPARAVDPAERDGGAEDDACPACGRLHFPWCAPHGGTGYATTAATSEAPRKLCCDTPVGAPHYPACLDISDRWYPR